VNAKVDISDVILETDRLIIRPWKATDLEDFYEYAKVDGVGQMAGWNPHALIEESKEILDMFIKGKNVFALELKDKHKVIGSVGLEEMEVAIGEKYDGLNGREIGYVLSKEHWGRGLMPEAVNRIIKFCFENEHYDYLICSHFDYNNQSKRVIEKSGFRFIKRCIKTSEKGEKKVLLYYVLDKNKTSV